MLTRTEYLLTCIAEEAVEVAQRATKAVRFGLDEVQPGQDRTNARRLMGEFHDLLARPVFPTIIAAWEKTR